MQDIFCKVKNDPDLIKIKFINAASTCLKAELHSLFDNREANKFKCSFVLNIVSVIYVASPLSLLHSVKMSWLASNFTSNVRPFTLTQPANVMALI